MKTAGSALAPFRSCGRMLLAAFGLLCLWSATISAAELQQVAGHVPSAVASARKVGPLPGTNYLRLAIGLPLRNQAGLKQLLAQLYDRSSSNYRHFLTPAEFADRFGPSQADYDSLVAFANSNGLAVAGTYANRMLLDVAGQANQIEKVFHTHLQMYAHPTEGRSFFAPTSEPSLDLATPILHISGLDNYVLPRPMNLAMNREKTQSLNQAWTGSGPGGSYQGNDFRKAYIPGTVMTGLGETVGVLEWESGFYQSDIASYEANTGLPNVPVTPVLLDGYSGGPGTVVNGNAECSLDIEMAISMAPGISQVLVFEGEITDDILNAMATNDVAQQLSSSFSFGVDATTEQIFQQFAAQGQSFYNASGDDNAWVGGVASPCDDPNITIVGGTTLTTKTNGAWLSETVWRVGNTNGSGGGISTTYSIPYWQQSVNMTTNHGSTAMRNIPDVALIANNVFITYGDGSTGIVAGTSCAAPLWAGFTALINQQARNNGQGPVGFINPEIYSLGGQSNYTNLLHDIVTGNNTNSSSDNLFFAVPGYDLCTGWGTPAGQSLIDAMVGTPNPTPAYIIDNPTNETATVGATAAFTVLAGGLPPFSYQWQCNGTNLIGATNDILILEDVQTNAAGYYDVIVTNEYGMAYSSTVELTVNEPGGCDPAPSGIVSWWPGNGNALDIIGTNNAVLEGGVSFVPGEVELGFSFTGATNFVLIPASPTLDVGDATGSFSLEAWINCSTTYQLNPIFEWNKGDGSTLWGVHFYVWSDGSLYANIENTNGIGQVIQTSPGLVTAGTFHHVALTYDYNSGLATIYCDGNTAAQLNIGQLTPETSYNLYLGYRPPTQGETYTFSGILDEPSLYNLALTSGEVAAIYNAGSAGKCAPAQPPMIGVQPTNETTPVNGTATFSVYASGTAPLNYQWMFNRTNILAGATNNSLTLAPVQANEAGYYSVVVTNNYGSVTSSAALLTIYSALPCDPPPSGLVSWWPGDENANDIAGSNNGMLEDGVSFTNGEVGLGFWFTQSANFVLIPASGSLDVGDATGSLTVEAWINCSTISQLNPIFEWNKGDGTTTWGVHFYVWSDGSLYANLENTNGVGQVLHPASIVITPGTFYHVALTYSQSNGLATIYCDGNVVGQANVGQLIPETSYNLYLGHRPLTQGATYTFSGVLNAPSLYNRALSQSEIGAIYLAGAGGKCPPGSAVPPSIVTQPANDAATEYGTASFSVVALGTPSLNYQWFFDQTNRIFNATNSTLVLTNLLSSQAGFYSVEVSNAFGTATSSNAVLTVLAIPPTITNQPTNEIVVLGNTAIFSVAAAGSTPLGYQWAFQGTNINGATNAILQLTGVHLSQAGTYRVTVTNYFGSVVSSNATLVVTGTPPAFVYQPVSESVQAGGEAILNSSSTGTAPLSYQWYFQGAALSGATNYYLILQDVLISQAGNYQILASNPFGAVLSTNAFLTVLAGPAIVSQPTNETVAIGSNPSLTVTATGTAPMYYHWLLNGTNSLANTTNATLSLSNVQTNNAGYYSVVITNAYGTATSSNALLTVLAPPKITAQPANLTLLTGTNATFTVVASGATNLAYQWYWNNTNLLHGATNASLTLTNIQTTNAGTYYVLVTNLVGSAASSNAVLTVNLGEHFVWSTIPSPRFVNVPFNVTLQVENLTNAVVTNYSGTVTLSSLAGIPVLPAAAGTFIHGSWSGTVTVAQPATNLVLQATDAYGDTGTANAINIAMQPVLNNLPDRTYLLLAWPTNIPGFVLQTSPKLNTTNWVPVTSETLEFGNSNLNIISITGTNAFFRLWYTNP